MEHCTRGFYRTVVVVSHDPTTNDAVQEKGGSAGAAAAAAPAGSGTPPPKPVTLPKLRSSSNMQRGEKKKKRKQQQLKAVRRSHELLSADLGWLADKEALSASLAPLTQWASGVEEAAPPENAFVGEATRVVGAPAAVAFYPANVSRHVYRVSRLDDAYRLDPAFAC